jgi:hypothetical protein
VTKRTGSARKLELPVKLPELRPQSHGGALLTRGIVGHRGGSGRPTSAIRQRLLNAFEDRVEVLESIADDRRVSTRDRIRAIDLLGKYGLGTIREMSVDDVKERLHKTLTVIRKNVSEAQARAIIEALKEVWL